MDSDIVETHDTSVIKTILTAVLLVSLLSLLAVNTVVEFSRLNRVRGFEKHTVTSGTVLGYKYDNVMQNNLLYVSSKLILNSREPVSSYYIEIEADVDDKCFKLTYSIPEVDYERFTVTSYTDILTAWELYDAVENK